MFAESVFRGSRFLLFHVVCVVVAFVRLSQIQGGGPLSVRASVGAYMCLRACVCVRACNLLLLTQKAESFFFKILLLSTHISFVLYHSINYLFCYLFVLFWVFFLDIIIILFVLVTVNTVVNVIANYAVRIIFLNIYYNSCICMLTSGVW